MADPDFHVVSHDKAEERLRAPGEAEAEGPTGTGPTDNGSADAVSSSCGEKPTDEKPTDEEPLDEDAPSEETLDEESPSEDPVDKEPEKRQEYVFVPFGALHDTDTLFREQSVESMRAEYQIIQRLKKINEMERAEESVMTESEMRESNLLHVTPDDSVEDIERKLIQRRCEEMRPDAAWKEIAESLGMSKKTLYQKRKRYDIFTELFD